MFDPKRKEIGWQQKPHTYHCRLWLSFLSVFIFFPLTSQATTAQQLGKSIPDIFTTAGKKYSQTTRLIPANKFPIITNQQGKWVTTLASGWSSGFLPGIYWILFEQNNDQGWRRLAEKNQQKLLNQQYNNATHDLGFIVFNSYGRAFLRTSNPNYRNVVLRTAKTLASRYNDRVGLIKSWGKTNEHQTIIDNIMNLEILFWSAKNGGEQRLAQIAKTHALNTMRDFVRPDGSTYHVVTYNPQTGKLLGKTTAQGKSNNSTWARGQAWAIYGFSIAYRETGDLRFLKTAEKTADYFIKNLPLDKVPYWDFNANKTTEPRDSSAAAIAASGLLELGKLEKSPLLKKKYIQTAYDILGSLSTSKYLSHGNSQGLLLHGTYNRNIGEYDSVTIWGDYYFLEALLKSQQTKLPR